MAELPTAGRLLLRFREMILDEAGPPADPITGAGCPAYDTPSGP